MLYCYKYFVHHPSFLHQAFKVSLLNSLFFMSDSLLSLFSVSFLHYLCLMMTLTSLLFMVRHHCILCYFSKDTKSGNIVSKRIQILPVLMIGDNVLQTRSLVSKISLPPNNPVSKLLLFQDTKPTGLPLLFPTWDSYDLSIKKWSSHEYTE